MNFKEYLALEKDFQAMIALTEESAFAQSDYALETLDKVEKVAAYLIKSKLKNNADIQRFVKFIDMVTKALPQLTKSAESIQKDIQHAASSYNHRYFA
jgi:hypothetical protein